VNKLKHKKTEQRARTWMKWKHVWKEPYLRGQGIISGPFINSKYLSHNKIRNKYTNMSYLSSK